MLDDQNGQTNSQTTTSGILLTWNPGKWSPSEQELERYESLTSAGQVFLSRWSTGGTLYKTYIGQRAFLISQGTSRGIVASGVVRSDVFEKEHWSDPSRLSTYIEVDWDTWLNIEDRIDSSIVEERVPGVHWRYLQSSGVSITTEPLIQLEKLWEEHLKILGRNFESLPEEFSSSERFPEGAMRRVEVNRYERDQRARSRAIEIHGECCSVCNFNFGSVYGELGQGFIQVHHIREVSTLPPGYTVNPNTDLIPLCSNCHSMIHRARPALSVEFLRGYLND